jgi:hypothetical protein
MQIMPRKKRVRKEPLLLKEFFVGIQKYQVLLIDEETESYGSGANKKLSYFKNFDLAFQKIVSKYFDGDQKIKRKLQLTLKNPKKLKPLMEQLELIGVDLNERALRSLAKRVRIEIKAFESAIKNNSITGTF